MMTDELSIQHTLTTLEAQRAVLLAGPSFVPHEVAGEAYNPDQMRLVVEAVQGLSGNRKEVESLLGMNNEPNAAAGSFAARIQLAHVLGILDESAVARLRHLKAMRNLMAHRVRLEITSDEVLHHIDGLHTLQMTFLGPALTSAERKPRRDEQGARNVVLTELALGHLVFHRILGRIRPVGAAWLP